MLENQTVSLSDNSHCMASGWLIDFMQLLAWLMHWSMKTTNLFDNHRASLRSQYDCEKSTAKGVGKRRLGTVDEEAGELYRALYQTAAKGFSYSLGPHRRAWRPGEIQAN